MSLINLTLKTLGDLAEGVAEGVINAALKQAVRDLDERGDDEKPRKVVIEIEMQKLGDKGIAARVYAQAKLPPLHTKQTVGKMAFDGPVPYMAFSPASPENPDQRTLVDQPPNE